MEQEKLASPLIAVALYASCVPVVLGALWSARAADARAASRYLRGFAARVGLAGCVALTLGANLAATLALTPPLLGALGARPFPREPALASAYAALAPASIEFCEPNFRSTGLVAEPHNVVSSVLGLVGPGAFGLVVAAPRSTGACSLGRFRRAARARGMKPRRSLRARSLSLSKVRSAASARRTRP